MGSNLANVIINQLIGVIIGTVVSFAMSWYFYKRTEVTETMAVSMIETVLRTVVADRLGVNLELQERPSRAQLPKDKDIPHIVHFWYSAKTLEQGDSAIVLFRIIDLGLNFPGPQGVEVTDISSGASFSGTLEGYGYYSCRIDFSDDAAPGQHTITFKLTDTKGKSNTQSIKLDVKPRSSWIMI